MGQVWKRTALAVRKSKDCVYSTCAHFKASGLSWPLTPDIKDKQLEKTFFPKKTCIARKLQSTFTGAGIYSTGAGKKACNNSASLS